MGRERKTWSPENLNMDYFSDQLDSPKESTKVFVNFCQNKHLWMVFQFVMQRVAMGQLILS